MQYNGDCTTDTVLTNIPSNNNKQVEELYTKAFTRCLMSHNQVWTFHIHFENYVAHEYTSYIIEGGGGGIPTEYLAVFVTLKYMQNLGMSRI